MERVHGHLRRRHEEEGKKAKKSKAKKHKGKKAKKSKAKKHKGKKAEKSKAKKSKAKAKAKKSKAKKAKQAKAKKVERGERRQLDSGPTPRVPQVSVGTVEHLEEIADKLESVGRKIGALRKGGSQDDFTQAQQAGRAFLTACLADSERVVTKHKGQLERHMAELDKRFRHETSVLEEHLGKIEAAHGELAEGLRKRLEGASAQEREAIKRASETRFAELRAAGQEAERKVHAMQAERESLKAQVKKGMSAVAQAQAEIHRAAAGLEEAIQDR